MQRLSSSSDRLAGRAAILAGVALTAGGITEIVHSQRHAGNRVVGVAGYLALSFVVALISLAPLHRSRAQGPDERSHARPPWPPRRARQFWA